MRKIFHFFSKNFLVGVQGFEPWTKEPKSSVLPLHHTPIYKRTCLVFIRQIYKIIFNLQIFCNIFLLFVLPTGFEPVTHSLEGCCSNPTELREHYIKNLLNGLSVVYHSIRLCKLITLTPCRRNWTAPHYTICTTFSLIVTYDYLGYKQIFYQRTICYHLTLQIYNKIFNLQIF